MKLNEIFQVFNDFKEQNEISEQDVACEFIQYLEQHSLIKKIIFEKLFKEKLNEVDIINFIGYLNLQITLQEEDGFNLKIQFIKKENDYDIIDEIEFEDKRAKITQLLR